MQYLYRTVVFIHVISAIASIGPFFVLYPLLRRLREASDEARSAYLNAFSSAVWFSKHSGHILVTTGVILVWWGPWSWRDTWIVLTLVVMIASLYFIARAFSPIIRGLRESTNNRDMLVARLKRNLNLFVIQMLIMLWFMVVKPMWW